MTVPAVFAIDGVARDYAWGSTGAIQDLLGLPRDGHPLAELWFGAHPDSPSAALGTTLDALIADDPDGLLGAATVDAFGPRLPFLLKVLAADKALSIQVHPGLAQAQAGFAQEDAAGVPRDAPHRNYRDPNHKPELICALSDFEALCGFRPVAATLHVLAALDLVELEPVAGLLRGPDGLQRAFTHLLTLPEPAPLVGAITARAADLPGLDAARAVLLTAADFPGDIGVALSLLLNYVRLAPGEAIFLGAGNVHAYLRGTGIEIMASSDNVLRCGLTPKHVDVAELLRITDFTELEDPRWPGFEDQPWGDCREFDTPVSDFTLRKISLDDYRKPGRPTGSCATGDPGQPYVVLCTEGRAVVSVGADQIELVPGHAAFVPARQAAFTITGTGVVFAATVGTVRGCAGSVEP